MTNSLVRDHQVGVVDVDEDVLEGSDMSWARLNGFLVKIRHTDSLNLFALTF